MLSDVFISSKAEDLGPLYPGRGVIKTNTKLSSVHMVNCTACLSCPEAQTQEGKNQTSILGSLTT